MNYFDTKAGQDVIETIAMNLQSMANAASAGPFHVCLTCANQGDHQICAQCLQESNMAMRYEAKK